MKLAGLAHHFVDLGDMLLLEGDLFPGVFFKPHAPVHDERQQIIVLAKCSALVIQRFTENLGDVVFMGLDQFADIDRLDPQYTKGPYLNILGVAKFVAGAYEEAIGAFRRNLEQGGPIGVPALAALTASYAVTGRAEEARESAQELLRFFPGFSVTRSRALFIFDTEARERLGAGLRKAGVPE